MENVTGKNLKKKIGKDGGFDKIHAPSRNALLELKRERRILSHRIKLTQH